MKSNNLSQMGNRNNQRDNGAGEIGCYCCFLLMGIICLIGAGSVFAARHCTIQSEVENCRNLLTLVEVLGYINVGLLCVGCCLCRCAPDPYEKPLKRNNASQPSSRR